MKNFVSDPVTNISIPTCFQAGRSGEKVTSSFSKTPSLNDLGKHEWWIACFETYENVQIASSARMQLPSLL